jgi:hypothetical protein
MQRRTPTETRRKRASVFLLAWFVLAVMPAGFSAQPGYETPAAKKALLVGTWTKRGLTYAFEDTVSLSLSRRESGPERTIRGSYSWLSLGTHTCISFLKNPSDSLSQQVVLVGEMNDSTAVLAIGMPFVRSGTGSGLTGTWNHAEIMTRIEWTFGANTVEYRKFAVDVSTGHETVAEEHKGTWSHAGTGAEPGSYEIAFGGNDRAVVLPMVYRDMMYLFDLSSGKSLFAREKAAPPAGERLTRR